MSVAVVVPLQGNCPHRARAWEWVRARYAEWHPDWQVCLATGVKGHAGADSNGLGASTGPPFCKAALVNPAIEATDAEIVILADADAWCEGLRAAVEAVEDGAPWAIPHGKVRRLTEEGTAAVLRGEPWDDQSSTQPPYQGLAGGGYVIARRETLLEVPLDPRFTGWGQEDASHATALHHLAGKRWRGDAPLIHLWHPPAERLSRKIGSVASKALWRRYLDARANPDEMRRLVEEGRVANGADESPVHPDPSLGVR